MSKAEKNRKCFIFPKVTQEMCTDISVVTCREKMLHLNITDVHKDLQGYHNIVNSFYIQQTNHKKKNIVILSLTERGKKYISFA